MVLGLSGEIHEVIYGNIQLGEISACKFYDRNANGVNDDEPPVAGILFKLDGVNIRGDEVHLTAYTAEDGCVTFADLLPGDYTLCEVLPPGWTPTTDLCVTIALSEADTLNFEFGNICEGQADFDTKGYWHNKNGLTETTQADFDYLNSLLPWQAPSSYFDAGDEPIDGYFEDGTPIPEARNVARELIAFAGTPWAEQSYFLVDRNALGDPREQLAQQLDAFIMNVLHRLDGNTAIMLPGDGWVVASDLIAQAIDVWAYGMPYEQTAMSQLLDEFNNSDAIMFIHYAPCPVAYP
ncbi:MAG: SdrD B-like domain-containing protein [Planctomycetota bacterium]